MGEWQNIKTEIKNKVAVLTVDHPPVNSFNTQVVTELGQAMDELLADDEVKVIIITGGGTRAFIAGADIPEIQAALEQPDGLRGTAVQGQALSFKIEKATNGDVQINLKGKAYSPAEISSYILAGMKQAAEKFLG